MWLTRLAITRPVTILMLVLALVILGAQSYFRLPLDLYPDIEFPMVFITTAYPGTGPEEIETLVTKPIEDSVSSIGGLKKMTSTSSEGVSTIRMEFELGTDVNEVSADVRSKLDALRNALPQDAKSPVVIKADIGAIPVIKLSIASDKLSPVKLRTLADDIIKDRLSQLSGVASVAVTGGAVREIRLEVDKDRLQAYGLSVTQVVDALRAENLNLPSGSIEEAQRTSSVRVMGEFTDPKQIEQVRIPAPGNPDLFIKDIAKVNDTIEKPSSYTRVDQESSVAIQIQKQSNANTVKVVDAIRNELGKLTGRSYEEATLGKPLKMENKPLLSDDIAISVAMDQSTFVKDTLNDVNTSLFEGALLAVLIVFLFLHSLRGTLIVGLAIPTSMIATFLIMKAVGFSLNMMSMMGLSLCVGILVDDSIVVIENIHRHLQMGESPKEAAINGRTEIGLAAMTITLVDVVVFVPIAFMGGIVGQFFRQFGIVVATATLFSLFISFTLTPMLASRWLKSHSQELEDEKKQSEHPGLFHRFVQAWERFYGMIDRAYRALLAWGLDHRAVVICLGFMTMLASFAVAMPKPEPMKMLSGLPVILLTVVVLFATWFILSLLPKLWRSILFLPVFALSIALDAIGSASANVGPATLIVIKSKYIINIGMPIIFTLLIITMLGIIAYVFSRLSPTTSPKSTFWTLSVGMCALFFLILFAPTKFGVEFAPNVDQGQFSIKIEHSVGTSLDVTNATAEMIEKDLFNAGIFPDTKMVFSSIGATQTSVFGGGSGGATDVAELNVELRNLDDLVKEKKLSGLSKNLINVGLMKSPLHSTAETVKAVNDRYKGLPGVKVSASAQSGMGGGEAPISIEVSGPDTARSDTVAQSVLSILQRTEGVFGAELSSRKGRPELQLQIDRDRAAQYGISVAQIASALRTSLEGDTTTKYREEGKEYNIRVSFPEAQRNILAQVPSMVVGATTAGQPIYLYDVVRSTPAAGPTKVERINRQRAVTVSAQLEAGYALGNMQPNIQKEIDKLNLDKVSVFWAGESEEMRTSGVEMMGALALSIALVFMLMAALFESLLSPLIIMLAVPQAMAGAMFALTLTHKTLNIITMIGIIMLVGLVTKNAILLVDYTNTLRKDKGMDRRKAILEAGPTRLRPILMTTMAMIFGMMPTAIALAKGSEMRQPMAIAVIGGLSLSMFLTLLMVPIFYEVVDNIGNSYGNLKKRIFGKAQSEESESESESSYVNTAI